MSNFSVAAQREPAGPPTVVVTGEVDVLTAPTVSDELDRLLDDAVPHIVLDLNAVTFMDSSGLRVLIVSDAKAKAYGGDLEVRTTSDPVRKALRLARLFERLHIVPGDSEPAIA